MTRTNQILAAVVAVALAGFGFYHFALAPKRDEVARLDGEMPRRPRRSLPPRRSSSTYEQAKASYKRNYTTLARLGKAVPRRRRRPLAGRPARGRRRPSRASTSRRSSSAAESEASPARQTPTDAKAAGDGLAPGARRGAGGERRALRDAVQLHVHRQLLRAVDVPGPARAVRDRQQPPPRRDRAPAAPRERRRSRPAPVGFPRMQAQISATTYLVPPVEAVAGAPTPATPPAGGATPAPPTTTTTASATTGATQ